MKTKDWEKIEMRINGIDYVDTNMISQPIQDFYDLLEREPRLRWLAPNYRKPHELDPIAEWQNLKGMIRAIGKYHALCFMSVFLVIGAMPTLLLAVLLENRHFSQLTQTIISA